MEAEEVEELVVQVQVGTYIQWVHNLFNKRGLPCIPVFTFKYLVDLGSGHTDSLTLPLSLSLNLSLNSHVPDQAENKAHRKYEV